MKYKCKICGSLIDSKDVCPFCGSGSNFIEEIESDDEPDKVYRCLNCGNETKDNQNCSVCGASSEYIVEISDEATEDDVVTENSSELDDLVSNTNDLVSNTSTSSNENSNDGLHVLHISNFEHNDDECDGHCDECHNCHDEKPVFECCEGDCCDCCDDDNDEIPFPEVENVKINENEEEHCCCHHENEEEHCCCHENDDEHNCDCGCEEEEDNSLQNIVDLLAVYGYLYRHDLEKAKKFELYLRDFFLQLALGEADEIEFDEAIERLEYDDYFYEIIEQFKREN